MKRFSIRKIIVIGYAGSLALIFFFAWHTYRNMRKAEKETANVNRTLLSLRTLEAILDDMQDIETGQRGFIISGNEQFLEPYYDGLNKIHKDTLELKSLTIDFPNRIHSFATLLSLIRQKLDFNINTVSIRKSEGYELAMKQVQTGHGKRLMDEIRKTIISIENVDRMVMRRSNIDREKAAASTAKLFLVLAFTFLFVLFIFYLLIRNGIRQQGRFEQRLQEFNEGLEKQVREKTREIIQSREEYYSLLNTIDSIVWEAIPATFKFTFVSKQAERLLGYPVEDWQQENFWKEHIHPEDRSAAIDFCIKSTRNKKPHEFEYRMIAADGRIVWIRDLVSLEIKDDEVVMLRGIMIDITQSKQAEKVLKESEERYRTLVDNAPEALVVFDVENRKFVSVSESATRLFKMSKEELLNAGPAELSPEIQPNGTLSAEGIIKNLHEAMAGKKPVFEWTHLDSQGNLIPCEVWLVRLPSTNQILIRGSVIDITERKKADAIIKESETKFRAFFESSMDGILLTTPDGNVLMANPAACAIFEMTEAEICILGRQGLVDLSDPGLEKLLDERRQYGRAKGELTMIRKSGAKFPVEISSSIFTDAYGQERTSMIIRDITERKKFEKQLHDSYGEIKQLTEYLQNIREHERSHIAREIHDELGQQLTALKMDVSWLSNKIKSDDQQVTKKLANLATMLDNTVKTVRRISSELRPSLLDDLGLVAAMDWHLHEFGRNLGIKTIFKDPGKDIYLPEAVKTGLFRIFQESLTNVARHAEARKVKVALEEFPKYLTLKIEDDGKGFDAAFTKTQKTLGILGMKERTSMIGGNYKIKSNIGKGTVVEVTVPYELKPEENSN